MLEDTNNSFWARGKNYEGQNMMGVLLELVRQKLMNEPIEIPSPTRQEHSLASPKMRVQIGNRIIHRQSNKQVTNTTRHNQVKCYRCGESGHVSRNCWYAATLRCTICSKTGHKANRCWYA